MLGLKPRQITKVGVIGGGLMGSCIATALFIGNIHVVLKEINLDYLQKGIKRIEVNVQYICSSDNLQGLVTKGKIELKGMEKALSILKGVLDYSDFKDTLRRFVLLTASWHRAHLVMPLMETVRTEKTSKQVILDLMTVGKTIKKVPILVGNCTGFAVNRTFFPYSNHRLWHANGSFQVELHDITGYGIAIAFGKEHATSFTDRTYQSPS
ncbi:peroxisomal fatty acid beta-oxidation multifunctional protein aim1 [Quercus suber]|uniref:Peroxisomal fatty acid beta-oxidation multifunctional protein aim1 n=1 Tax=Quercus suber TaxID=58331 RepID=A0AAW0LI32_QUESU